MIDIKNTNISEFNYPLPQDRIAKYPLAERDSSKLLVYNNSSIKDCSFKDAANLLPENSILVANNTKVIHARLEFFKETGARIEIFCLEPIQPRSYELCLSTKNSCTWKCIVGNAKKWKEQNLQLSFTINNVEQVLCAKKDLETGTQITFSWNGDFTFGEILEAIGEIPIPPYLQRKSEEIDSNRYQTKFAQFEGSVAAPTAGLHFTERTFSQLKEKNITQKQVTLHVGAGTFKPVSSENYSEHAMHREFIDVNLDLIQLLAQTEQTITAVGTTTVRTLESLYWLGVKLLEGKGTDELLQWEAYSLPQNVSRHDSFGALLNYMQQNALDSIQSYTQIMIVPGYKFRVISMMFTNFHQPQSTLLLLVCAFIGEDWKKVYKHALENDYRFLSYGDSSLLTMSYKL